MGIPPINQILNERKQLREEAVDWIVEFLHIMGWKEDELDTKYIFITSCKKHIHIFSCNEAIVQLLQGNGLRLTPEETAQLLDENWETIRPATKAELVLYGKFTPDS